MALNILFIRTDRLGETLLNLPAVSALKTALSGCSITLLVHPELQELLTGLPTVSAVITSASVPTDRWWVSAGRLAKQLRAMQFDIAIVSNPRKDLHLAMFLAGIPTRVGYDRKWSWTLTHRLDDRKGLGERHEVEYNLDLVKALGVAVPSIPALHIPISVQEQQDVSQVLNGLSVTAGHRVVTVHPWTSNPKKQWLLDRFRRLIERLQELPGVAVAVIGSANEQETCRRLLGGLRPGVLDLVGRLSLRQLGAFLGRVHVLVSNDSGPVHLAAAVGAPTVVLFASHESATGPQRWGPWGTRHTVICKPAMEQIEVDDVMQAVRPYLR